ncbi:zinc finger protein 266 isoform X1 [Bombyx mori]|uniref:C2H2-type domain-containing protein n=2 Tax=Bombyx mori TaxID=7091 RepID=A0A8R1WLJ5_BOMMO|nr:zinc finger protein 266 [Bombyx mori]
MEAKHELVLINQVENVAMSDLTCNAGSCNDEQIARYVCRICKKSFYNAKALQNHKNMQHDPKGSENGGNTRKRCFGQDINAFPGFKFISMKGSTEGDTVNDSVTTRTFSEDTTYFIIKVQGEGIDGGALKTTSLGGIINSTQMKVKPAVNLRGPFTCTFPSMLRPDVLCRQIFFDCCDYSRHYREEHTKRRKAALRCQVCEKPLDKEFNQNNPVQRPSVTTLCRICGETFSDNASYVEHNRFVHAKMKPYQCPICAKRFTQQGGLQQHMRMHSGIRPFACTYCPKAFTQKAGLDQHLRTHTKIKPFRCVICGKCFSQSVHLRQHMRTHTNIQPFECVYCGKRFKQTSHLNFHLRSHVGEGVITMEKYAQAIQPENQLDFLNFASLQPVQDGDTLYYAAELAPPNSMVVQRNFPYQVQSSDGMLPI